MIQRYLSQISSCNNGRSSRCRACIFCGSRLFGSLSRLSCGNSSYPGGYSYEQWHPYPAFNTYVFAPSLLVVSTIYMCLQSAISFGLILFPVNHWTYFVLVLLEFWVIYIV